MTEHEAIVKHLQAVQNASRKIVTLDEEAINSLLINLADRIPDAAEAILEANRKDLERMNPDDPRYDRLLLNEDRLKSIATDLHSHRRSTACSKSVRCPTDWSCARSRCRSV